MKQKTIEKIILLFDNGKIVYSKLHRIICHSSCYWDSNSCPILVKLAIIQMIEMMIHTMDTLFCHHSDFHRRFMVVIFSFTCCAYAVCV